MDHPYPLRDDVLTKTIEQLDGVRWPPPTLDSYVARTSFALRSKPLVELDDEELRVGLEQQVGVKYLVPLALFRLKRKPLLEASLFPGDLLQAVLNLPPSFWTANPEMKRDAAALAEIASHKPGLAAASARFSGRRTAKDWLRASEGAAPPPSQPTGPSAADAPLRVQGARPSRA